MKTRILFLTLLFSSILVSLNSCQESTASTDDEIDLVAEKSALIDNCPGVTGTITEKDAEGLIFMWEEEKMARDVYAYFFDKYKHRVFGNITKSEAIHQLAVTRLMEGFEVENPGSDAPGTFLNEHIAELYATLIEMGELSLVDALKAGALIEETDILDLKEWLNQTENPSVTRVFTNLLKASENHLRAFTGVLKLQGVVYEPSVLNDDYYAAILSRQVPDEYRAKGYNAGK
jgi:hypothetical protein